MALSHPETWTIRKPAVRSEKGVVASQHYLASEVGAQVLRDGGNAVDAAIATSFAVGVVEPWMSGLGGGGYMVIQHAGQSEGQVIDFGMISSRGLNIADYPLTGDVASDLFSWPEVTENRNILGATAVAVPGQVAGMALALEAFGSRTWPQCLMAAIDLAEAGLQSDWYAALLIGNSAKELSQFPSTASVFLPNGEVPKVEWDGAAPVLDQSSLASTLKRLSDEGPQAFYNGNIASRIARDIQANGGQLDETDLDNYKARQISSLPLSYRGATIHAVPGLSAGPTLEHTLRLWTESFSASDNPGADAFEAYGDGLNKAYVERLSTMGDVPDSLPSCTTHISVIDSDGLTVSLTQTLLSLFGSKLLLPESGILMNNGVMWFDPRPGRPNSMGPGKRPLSNMCPIVVDHGDGRISAIGASGGRRILPAVSQVLSFLVDFDMSVEDAIHHPRLDANGENIHFDRHLPSEVHHRLTTRFGATPVQATVYPAMFACPNAVQRTTDGVVTGSAYPLSPWAAASGS